MFNKLMHPVLWRAGLASGLTLVLVLGACANAGSPRPSSSSGGEPSSELSSEPSSELSAAPSEVAAIRCAKTPDAVAVATVKWNQVVEGSPTIHAGEAVEFVTTLPSRPTVTEGVNGVPASHACIDQTLLPDSPLILTFYEAGDYHIFCRKDPTTMVTVVHVQ